MRFGTALFLASAASLAGCTPKLGTFNVDGFHDHLLPYAVHYSDARAKQFLSENWKVDNFVVNDDGTLEDPKTTTDYRGPQKIDLAGDGTFEKIRVYYFDLKLDNKKTNAVIWIQTVPLGRDRAERNLKNLAEDYAEALSGSGFYATVTDLQRREVRGRGKTFAARLVDGKDTKLGGFDAYDARVDFANVDQLQIDPNARRSMIRVVLVRPPYLIGWGEDHKPTPALLRIGFEASPGDFEAGMPDFERFLSLLEFAPAQSKDDVVDYPQ
ncbi:MAG TPA: hypothetical protein VGI39_03615 [Polyangiaceae bacterium]|jgi:hypothetical protein